MKEISKTNINRSNRSLISTIPHTIVILEELSSGDKIRWNYEIKDNKPMYYIEFIKESTDEKETVKTNKNTSNNIDETIQKQEKKETKNKPEITSPSETTDKPEKTKRNNTKIKEVYPDIESELKKYDELKQKKAHKIYSYDNVFQISIQKNIRSVKLNFKLNFRIRETKDVICNITYKDGSLENSCDALLDLCKLDKDEVIEWILKYSKTAKKNLIKYGLME